MRYVDTKTIARYDCPAFLLYFKRFTFPLLGVELILQSGSFRSTLSIHSIMHNFHAGGKSRLLGFGWELSTNATYDSVRSLSEGALWSIERGAKRRRWVVSWDFRKSC